MTTESPSGLQFHNDPEALEEFVPHAPTLEIIIRLDEQGTHLRGLVNGKQKRTFTVPSETTDDQPLWQTVLESDAVGEAIQVLAEALGLTDAAAG